MATEEDNKQKRNRLNELRSEPVQEILSFIPNWIVRWGITVVFFTVCAIILASWFIRYPDIVNAQITITTENPPAAIIARASGRLNLLVNENDTVQKNDYLGVIENPANADNVFLLKRFLEQFVFTMEDSVLFAVDSFFSDHPQLGELQSYYLGFLKAVRDYKLYLELNFTEKQIESIRQQIDFYDKLNENLLVQKSLVEKELALIEKGYRADSTLLGQNAIPALEVDKSKVVFLQKKQSLGNAQSNIINNKIQTASLEKQASELLLQQEETRKKYLLAIEDALRTLQNQLLFWEQQYVLKAPVGGLVSFFKFRSGNQFVNVNEEVMSIVSPGQDVYGLVMMPAFGSGKVKNGQSVNIKFDNYPFAEYGMVEGRIKSISLVPRNNVYSIEVDLPKGLNTSYHKQLDFKQEMQGQAEIITEDLRLMQRIFNQFRTLIKNLGKK